MSNDAGLPSDPTLTAAADAKRMLRQAKKATLATLESASGYPYGSLVAMATESDGAPILLLSRLALHTKNIDADARASILIESASRGVDPLASGRVTLIGQVWKTQSCTAERRFLSVHPSAAGYARFADFDFFVMQLESAHYVGGFGRIKSLSRQDILLDVSGAGELIDAEPEILATLAAEHAPEISRLGAALSGKAVRWRISGIDPAGCDLACGDERLRCEFPEIVTSAAEAWNALHQLLEQS